jgi:hypothetical protein
MPRRAACQQDDEIAPNDSHESKPESEIIRFPPQKAGLLRSISLEAVGAAYALVQAYALKRVALGGGAVGGLEPRMTANNQMSPRYSSVQDP